jgi:hypothetical protein
MGPIQTPPLDNTEEEIYCEVFALIRSFRCFFFIPADSSPMSRSLRDMFLRRGHLMRREFAP